MHQIELQPVNKQLLLKLQRKHDQKGLITKTPDQKMMAFIINIGNFTKFNYAGTNYMTSTVNYHKSIQLRLNLMINQVQMPKNRIIIFQYIQLRFILIINQVQMQKNRIIIFQYIWQEKIYKHCCNKQAQYRMLNNIYKFIIMSTAFIIANSKRQQNSILKLTQQLNILQDILSNQIISDTKLIYTYYYYIYYYYK
eukprot:TRINITY_DN10778_c0_g1_i6.p2 TRINITY_DN10778_c0_g1~~TRINITY_DN10778_c0_g1_i6.p2  ORF type:complete len:196 (-),score=-16.25 TRINITY_DN10778_c0_g1_i6:238-825(-)